MKLKNLNILIISPNYWGTMFVSKHWYAIELAKNGNAVYFLEPPNLKEKLHSIHLKDYGNLFLVKGDTLKRGQKYFPRFINELVDQLDVIRIKKNVG